jgi:outer membrane autotransporter protein
MPEEDPFAWLRPGKRQVGRTGVWGRYVGNWRNVEGDANARGLRAQTNGVATGVDNVVSDELMIGVAGLYAETESKFARAPADEGDIKTYQAGAYASWGDADFYMNVNATAIWNEFDTRRRIQTGPATFAFAEGDFDGFGGTGFIEFGSVFEEDGFRLQPLASIFYMTHTTDEFTERGAPTLNLIVAEASTQSLRSSLGARLSHPFKWGETRIVPELRTAWRHEFLDVRQDSSVAFAHDPTIQMNIVGSDHGRDMAVFGLGLSASLGRETVLFSDVDGAFSADKNSVQASVGLRHSW